MIPSLYALKVQYVILAFLGVPFSYLFDLHFRNDEQYRKTVLDANREFNFIIVGGGTAGLVVANRLSEHFNVLLIEAGGHPFPLTAVPGFAPTLLNHPDIDWVDKTVPQEHACNAQENNGANLNHGKGLGGSSMLNFMMYMRGSPEDYNEWARVTKDNQWSYDSLLPYFRKMENYQGGFSHNDTHGTDGPMNIARSPYNKLMYEWEAAGKELGYGIVDPNGHQEAGFFPLEYNLRNASRHSTYSAYLEPILTRDNLTIELYAHVSKVEFDGKNRAVGVHYIKDGRENYVKASKEIVLSAGSLGSPKILMLSGVGPTEHLNSLGIPVLQDLPVGQNLQDHILTEIGPFILDSEHSFNHGRDMTVSVFSEYLENNKGPLGTWLSPGGAVIESSLAEKGWPDLLLIGASSGVYDGFTDELSKNFGYKKELLDTYFEGLAGNDTFSVAVALGRPKGRGELKLASIDPFEPPLVDPNYLHHPDDLQTLIEGVQFAVKIMETETFKSLGAKLTTKLFPGCEQHGSADNDNYWKCFVRHLTRTMWHYSSTCKMGAKGDMTAVLDTKLRVRGTKGLRVIDNSVMPQVTNANTHIPAVVIGEKGADLILQKHLKKRKNVENSKEYNKTTIKPKEEKIKMELQNPKDDGSIIQKPEDIRDAATQEPKEEQDKMEPQNPKEDGSIIQKPEDIGDAATQEPKEEHDKIELQNPKDGGSIIQNPEDTGDATQEPKEEEEEKKEPEKPEDIENTNQEPKEEKDEMELQEPQDDGNTIQKSEANGDSSHEPKYEKEDKKESKKSKDKGKTTNKITEKQSKKELKKPKKNGKATDEITGNDSKKNLKKPKDKGKTTDNITEKEGKKNHKKPNENGKTIDKITEKGGKKDLKKPKDNGKTSDKPKAEEENGLKKPKDNGKASKKLQENNEQKNGLKKPEENGKTTNESAQKNEQKKKSKESTQKNEQKKKSKESTQKNEQKKKSKESTQKNEQKKKSKESKENKKTHQKPKEHKKQRKN